MNKRIVTVDGGCMTLGHVRALQRSLKADDRTFMCEGCGGFQVLREATLVGPLTAQAIVRHVSDSLVVCLDCVAAAERGLQQLGMFPEDET